MLIFTAKIELIGINPYVLLPEPLLQQLFEQAGYDKGAIPVRISLGEQSFVQNLVKYSGAWRLYLNTPMREASQTAVGDEIEVGIEYDPVGQPVPMHPKLEAALSANEAARAAFDQLSPYRKKEIMRYINSLKTAVSVEKNIRHTLGFLLDDGKPADQDKT